jgi:hypothetical protein
MSLGELRNEIGGVPDSRFHVATHISRLRARALLSADLEHVRAVEGAKACSADLGDAPTAHLGSLPRRDRRPALEFCESPRRSAAPDNREPCNCANAVIRADRPDDRRADDLLGLENGY